MNNYMKVVCFVFSFMIVTGCDGKDQSQTISGEAKAVEMPSAQMKSTPEESPVTASVKVKTTLEGTIVQKESKAKEGQDLETVYILKASDAKYRLKSETIDLSQYAGKKVQAVLIIEEKISKKTGKERQVVKDIISLTVI